MTYEMILDKLNTGRMTMATMIRLQKAVGKKIGALGTSEEQLAKMAPDEVMEQQIAMLEVVANLVFIAMGSPVDSSPEDIAELIPFDKTEEISTAIGKYMNATADVKKN